MTRLATFACAVTMVAASSADAAFRRGDMGSGWGSPLTISQQANQLTVGYQVFSAHDLQSPLRVSFALDGSESRNTVMIGHANSEQRSTAAWNGNTLVITTRMPGPNDARGLPILVQLRQALTLESRSTLIVEATRVGLLGAATSTNRVVYTKR